MGLDIRPVSKTEPAAQCSHADACHGISRSKATLLEPTVGLRCLGRNQSISEVDRSTYVTTKRARRR
jgi:hypothetical protein